MMFRQQDLPAARLSLDPNSIHSQQDALAVELGQPEIGIPSMSRILAIVDMVKYVEIPQEVENGNREGCGICYDNLEQGRPKGTEVQVLRQRNDGMLTSSYIIKGTSSRQTHHTAQLPCGHYFGSRCIWQHLLENQTCPYCRHDYGTQMNKYTT